MFIDAVAYFTLFLAGWLVAIPFRGPDTFSDAVAYLALFLAGWLVATPFRR